MTGLCWYVLAQFFIVFLLLICKEARFRRGLEMLTNTLMVPLEQYAIRLVPLRKAVSLTQVLDLSLSIPLVIF